MYYGIGLDIGVASVGSAVMMLNDSGEPQRIIHMGSRVFDAAENADFKQAPSLALPRRENRSMRRRLRRRAFRKYRVRELIKEKFDVTDDSIAQIYERKELPDIYAIRSAALDEKLEKDAFIRLLIHLSQRRGFRSNRKVDSADKKGEDGKLLSAVKENQARIGDKGYRTVGEMLYKDEKFSSSKRNRADFANRASYENAFTRKQYENEVRMIFARQRSFGNEFASEELESGFLDIMLSQRAFDEGPGKPSQYGGDLIEKMIGRCTLEENELRAVKASDTFERFNLFSKVNALKVNSRSLNAAERRSVTELAYTKNDLTYADIRKKLRIGADERFNISYGEKSPEEVEKKTRFSYLRAYHTFSKAYGTGAYTTWSTQKRNDLAWALTVYKNDEKISSYLAAHAFTPDEITIALTLPSFTKTGNLSVKAMERILPYLEQGFVYNEACEKAGYHFKADEKSARRYLPQNADEAAELNDIVNPVVRRSVSQTIKVVNAIIRQMGESPVYVNIELARELSRNRDDRRKIEKTQEEHRADNDRLMDEIKALGVLKPSGMDLVKYKLYKEQDGRCLYSLKALDLSRLFESGYAEVDHIVPYSISFDDSYNNKVLVLSVENRQKGNRLPLEYLGGERRENFQVYVESARLPYRKKQNLLREKLTEDDVSGFQKRNLTDTQYISSFMLNFIKRHLAFTPLAAVGKNTVRALNGAATGYVRGRWGIRKIRENGDTHHAVDAVVIACITQSMIKRISDYAKRRELYQIIADPTTNQEARIDANTGELVNIGENRFPTPYPWFRAELEMRCSDDPSGELRQLFSENKSLPYYEEDERVKPIFVSRMPQHKVTGAAHKETVFGTYTDGNGTIYTVSKKPLTALKLKDGEIENYYNPTSDLLLYNALKQRLLAFGGKAEKAFAEPFYKPRSDGTQGPLVKKVKLMDKATLTVPVHGGNGVAANDSMVRVDVFYVENDGYYLVPIYVADTVKPVLPGRAIVGGKPFEQWKEMDDTDFIFSLYPNDLIRVESRREIKMFLVNKSSTLALNISPKAALLYFRGADIATASIIVRNHDNTYQGRGLGVKTLLSLEKYQVDVLGNVSRVGREKRMGFK